MVLRKSSGRGCPTRRTRFTRRVLTSGGSLALAGLILSGCGTSTSGASGVVHAVGAENQYANVIAQIGGTYVDVTSVMSNPNTDPHTFEVSTDVARSIAGAQLIVQNGVGYDAFMDQIESATPSSSRKVLTVQSLLGLATDVKNPHLWYKPATMQVVATRVERDLATLQPTHAAYFKRRLATFNASFQTLDKAITSFRSRFKGVKVATTEPVADYLLEALGLNNVTPFRFQADIMNGIDPSPEDVSYQQKLFNDHDIKVFCYNAQVSSTVTVALRALAKSTHVPVVAVYETMPAPGYDYQSWMLAEINALSKAIVTKASTTSL